MAVLDLAIAGRKAIVCASSRGIGKACALALAEAGASVVVNGRDAGVLAATAEEIRSLTNVEVIEVVADINKAEGQAALLAACPAPDILINNNAGPGYPDFKDLDRDQIFECLTMNMVVPFEIANAVVEGMAERRFGRIVNITSMSVKIAVPGLELSSGARAGLTAFLAGVARRVVDRNVTINHILPGYVDTERMRQNVRNAAQKQGRTEGEIINEREQSIPAKRFAAPDEIGQLCAFLSSRYASYITGQNVVVDGGICNISF